MVHLLSLAFLCAQFGMLAHAGSHSKSDSHGAPATQLCGECLSFAPLQNMVGGAPTLVLSVAARSDYIDAAHAAVEPLARSFSAFRSRAPPILL